MGRKQVIAVVLAAGEGRRMGTTKQLLPWGDTTVLGQTLRHLQQSSVDAILVVTGHRAEAVAAVAIAHGAAVLHNPDYAEGEMLSSLQVAIHQLPSVYDAVLVVLADQPQVTPDIINPLLEAFRAGQGDLIAPVFRGRRGNPVLIGRPFFAELLDLPRGEAPRALLRRHAEQLTLLPVASGVVLEDLDLRDEYEQRRPTATIESAEKE